MGRWKGCLQRVGKTLEETGRNRLKGWLRGRERSPSALSRRQELQPAADPQGSAQLTRPLFS